ncbi:MAG TPA: 2-dehydropantoate 2-reductase [Stellaceae bacterium]|nr:2-dehydropantoate 2-reductase [Stellaceae bacterium]
MKVCVFGAGAVGGHLAAKLARAAATIPELEVSIVARGPHLAAIRADGLRFQGAEESFTSWPHATDDPATLGPQDIVISAVKAPALPGIVPALHPLLKPDTPIVYAINGIPWWYFHGHAGPRHDRRMDRLDPGGRLWDEIGVERAIACVIYSANEVLEPGLIRNNSKSDRFILGEPTDAGTTRIAALAQLLEQAGCRAPVADDIRREIWIKLLGNMASSPITCLTGATTGNAISDPDLKPIFRRMMEEGVRVAAAYGIEIDAQIDERLASNSQLTTHRPSMLQDLQASRSMEIDGQLIAVQDLARAAGIETPTADILIALLKHRARLAGLY